MKKLEKALLLLTIFAAIITLTGSMFVFTTKMLSSSSILFGISGLLQLELTGFFDEIFYDLSEAAEGGVYPSNIYRHIILNPEIPVCTFLVELIYYNRKCGLGLLLFGSCIQLTCVWL